MVHVVFFVEARPFLPYRAYFLTNVGDNLVYNLKLHESTTAMLHFSVTHIHMSYKYSYLELLVGEATAWTAGALDSDGRRPS